MAPKLRPRPCKGSEKGNRTNAAGLGGGGRKARAKSQQDEGGGQTRTKRPRLEFDAALPPNATLASSPDTEVALPPASVTTISPDAPSSPNPMKATIPSTAPSPGGAVLPSTNSIAPQSTVVAAAAPLGTSENEQVAGEKNKGQTCTNVLRPYGNIAIAIGAKDAWDCLSRAIRELARDHFVKVVDWDTLDTTNKEKLATWAPWAEEYLTCDYQPGTEERYGSRSKLRNARSSCRSPDPLWLHSDQILATIAIFEGWIWRILVDRVFETHDGELWDGYGGLVTKLGGKLCYPLLPSCPHKKNPEPRVSGP